MERKVVTTSAPQALAADSNGVKSVLLERHSKWLAELLVLIDRQRVTHRPKMG